MCNSKTLYGKQQMSLAVPERRKTPRKEWNARHDSGAGVDNLSTESAKNTAPFFI